jgi:glycosyltransferase involved in cell wall biosynthesis
MWCIDMIVVASHNDVNLLSDILADLSNCDLNGHEVLIVDTNSADPAYLKEFQKNKIKYPQFNFIRKDYTCWDSGAYIHAYNNYDADKYIFLQDSLRITNPNVFKEITVRLDSIDVLALFNFFYFYDNEEQQQWVEEHIPMCYLPMCGIFGPVFSARKDALDRIPKHWLKEPTNKLQGCGMERRWALMFHALSLRVDYLTHFYSPDHWRQHESVGYQTIYGLRYFSKIFKHRL